MIIKAWIMNRYDQLKKLMDQCRYFKTVCGAGNEDPQEVRRLTMVYALAGACSMDVSANVDVVKGAMQGLDTAELLAEKLGKTIPVRPYINVSVGLKGDPHIRKARIDKDICTQCGNCLDKCLQDAIDDNFVVAQQHCIGCGKCDEQCDVDAIKYYDKRVNLQEIIPECLASGAETLELHAIIADDDAVMADWKLLNSMLKDNYISMCLDRHFLSDVHLLDRIQRAYEISGDRLIIQADGIPMGGGEDDYKSTLQAIAIADIIEKSGIPCKLLASGGTNSKTRELARLCGVHVHGVSIGTYARRIVKHIINRPDFDDNLELIGQAVQIAEQLVKVNIA
jgi:Fe-S-cluster-containing hydrogenase component 2